MVKMNSLTFDSKIRALECVMDLAGLYPYPESWYALGTSDELPVGGVLSRRLAG